MLNIQNEVLLSLKRLGLSPDEAKVYLTLLEKPMSRLEVARKRGINRTKVYRIADELAKRGLIIEEVNDTGRELTAADPLNLEIALTTAEERLKAQRQVYGQIIEPLQQIYLGREKHEPNDFVINSYEGIDGFKQMLWNELKTKNEILVFGSGTIQDLVGSIRWAEKHRNKSLEAGYKIRELINPNGKPENFTNNTEFREAIYEKRCIDPNLLPLSHQMCIYNDTVSLYNWRNDQKVGVEVTNRSFADMQRAIFENYWRFAVK